jgi:hypothetical protein
VSDTGFGTSRRRFSRDDCSLRIEAEQLTDVLMSELLERERASDEEFTERGTRLDGLVGIVSQHRRGFFD